MKDVRASEIDIGPSEMDFHIHVVRRRGRIDVKNRFIVRVVDKPADTVCVHSVGLGDRPLNIGRAGNGRNVDMICVMREVGDRIELAGAGL